MKYLFPALLLLGCLLGSCVPRSVTGAGGQDPELTALQTAMTGSYSSAVQASVDTGYYDIDLHMQPIWPDRGYYLYVEQALAGTPKEPYRQRVYQLRRKGKQLISRVFELPEPDRFVGAYNVPDRFATLSPDELVERKGCAVVLREEEPGVYRGNTRKRSCKSSLRGAKYATSRVTITGSIVQSWDRGFNTADEQVWGATEGGYMFLKE